jgi:hypothetical protein
VARTDPIPEWVKDAIWYYLDVPCFRNGEPANDAPGTPPWGIRRSTLRLPGEQVILVQNYGDIGEPVELTAGSPGQPVTVLCPQLEPTWLPPEGHPPKMWVDTTEIPEMPIGAEEQILNSKGEISLTVDSMSVSLVLVNDQKAR